MGGYIGRGQPVAAGGNSVETADIIDDAVTNAKIATNAVTGDSIASNAVGNSELSDNAVATAEIADDAVTAAKLANSINTDIATGPAALPKAGGTMTGNIEFGNNLHAKFGNNSGVIGLDIYSDNNASFIHETGSGHLYVRGSMIILKSQADNDDYMKCYENGSVNLFYSNAEKFATTSNGIKVTDRVTGSSNLILATTDSNEKIHMDANGWIKFETAGSEAMRIVSSGHIGIGTDDPTRTVDINHPSTAPDLRLGCDGNDAPMIILDADVSSADDAIANIVFRWNNTDTSLITGYAGADTTNKDDGGLKFYTRTSGSGLTERMNIDSSGNITWTGALLHATTGGRIMDLGASGTTGKDIRMRATTGYGGAWIFEGNDGGYGTMAELRITTETACGGLAFFSEKSDGGLKERFRIDDYGGNTGDIHFFEGETGNPGLTWDCSANTLKLLNGNLIIGTAGKGIDFSAYATSGNPSSNLLDDYEEGTWTPACTAFTIGSTPSAKYTKIGRQVTIQLYMEVTSNSGNANGVLISGLPFNVAGSGWSTGAVNMSDSNTVVDNLHVRAYANSGDINIKKNNDTTMIGTEIDAGHLVFTVTYFTA